MSKVYLLDGVDATLQLTVNSEIPANIMNIKAPEIWAKGITGKGVTVAVIDTGCDSKHKDLAGRILGGRNFTKEDKGDVNNYTDYHGHGTHVAGIIAANKNNSGMVGVAPNAKLLILKALDKNGSGNYSDIVSAVNYAVQQKVDIISMSLGGPTDYKPLKEAIIKAVQANICVVCAAANNGDGKSDTSEFAYPAYYTDVISVGALDGTKTVAPFSNSNNQVDLIAPGVNIVSTYIGNKYAKMSGTSMAAPHVSGALALLKEWGKFSFGRPLSELELYAQLIKQTVSIGQPKTAEGNGMLYLTAQDELEKIVKKAGLF